jgi:3-oxoisoapionate kinase
VAKNPKPILSYYGDDFTGSTDVMEALASNGVPTVLFLNIPDSRLLSRFSDCQAIGIAGTSRSETPDWMDKNLVAIFEWLKSLEADFCHYKVCSTFDSSPTIGSIGKALEIGKSVFEQKYVPLVVGAPQLKRYTAFGHLFAAYRDQNYRIDRHPVMGRHPVTPMHESDLRLHLSKQTTLETVLIDLVLLQSKNSETIDRITAKADGIVLFDVESLETQSHAGEQLWRLKKPGGWFVAGSSGVEYALLAHAENMAITNKAPVFASPGKVERIAVVSGSVSPTTERQIQHAGQNGFALIAVNPLDLGGDDATSAIDSAIAQASEVLRKGRNPLVYTALGSTQDIGIKLDKDNDARHRIGRALGQILRRLVEIQNLKRVVIAGGDTSSHALRELDIEALTMLVPLPTTPGSPLCLAHGSAAATDGLQIALKGGQIGNDDYFSTIRSGSR